MADAPGYVRSINVDRDKLILDHVPLLRHIAGRMALDLPSSFDREDLTGYGMLGLIQAADTFEVGRGLKFSTYAFTKIRGAILDELRRQDFLPRGRREKVREVDRAVARIMQATGAPPSTEELAADLGASMDEIDEILLSAKTAGRTTLDDEGGEGLSALLSDPRSDDPQGSAEWLETKERLEQAIRSLSLQDKQVITLYYAEDLMLREIAEILGVTESRVSQIHTRALYRLNRELGGEA
ncbi:MAG: FliA/WhiG family RNA polymerase sigma factor [Planctomycetota bacterium]